MAESRCSTQRALTACSVWLTVGFIGASALAAGLVQLFNGELEWLSALALALSGGMLATVGWRRSRSVLQHAERVSPVATSARSDPASHALQALRRRRDRHVARHTDAIGPEAQ